MAAYQAIRVDETGNCAGLVEAVWRVGEPLRMASGPPYYVLGEAASAKDSRVLRLGEGADEFFGS